MGSQLHYLTVQDILWINLQVTGKVQHFSFAKLEEATYYQYAYGDSNHLVAQAARFLPGFLKMHPLDAGNEATAFVACLAFLKINGLSIELQDPNALAWFESIASRKMGAGDAIKSITKASSVHHEESPDVRKTVKDFLGDFACTIQKL